MLSIVYVVYEWQMRAMLAILRTTEKLQPKVNFCGIPSLNDWDAAPA